MTKGIRLEVEATQISVSTSAELIDVATQWIAIRVFASVDAKGSNVFLEDVAAAVDALAMAFALEDRAASMDTVIAHIESSLLDATASDDLVTSDLDKSLFDRSSSSDALAYQVAWGDFVQSMDLITANLTKALADVAASSDSLDIQRASVLSDESAAADSGVAYIQNYIADYFEPEYIGDKFTF
ncbi:hypothetical protein RE432_14830 [Pusillimonas sp. SM2304]|uniref:hypothetical protein n=1 Tax=Pusillimonas sp. SM2304 TaxID=3073241 RepID=UPI00287659C4|nr:hypothetical protein [Pusillimonas sp. SM2304]MDS1141714.1 hypothetical protein [Pusillimonas sp. SM2304]